VGVHAEVATRGRRLYPGAGTLSTTAFRDDDVGASLRADELEAKLARVVSALEARVGQRRPSQGLHALPPMAILAALFLKLESPPLPRWSDSDRTPIVDPLWTALSKLPFTFAVALGVTAVLSALPVVALAVPTDILPWLRAARVRRLFAPPPRSLRASERVEALERTLAAALASWRDR
jgi:hypothetical protein